MALNIQKIALRVVKTTPQRLGRWSTRVATIRQRDSGSWEVVIRRKGILKRVHYASADTEADAFAYARRIEGQLDQGIMPVELLDSAPPSAETALWTNAYVMSGSISIPCGCYLNVMPAIRQLMAKNAKMLNVTDDCCLTSMNGFYGSWKAIFRRKNKEVLLDDRFVDELAIYAGD